MVAQDFTGGGAGGTGVDEADVVSLLQVGLAVEPTELLATNVDISGLAGTRSRGFGSGSTGWTMGAPRPNTRSGRMSLRQAIQRLYRLSTSELAALQMQLAQAGLIDVDAVKDNEVAWGTVDDLTLKAWSALLTLHVRDRRMSVRSHLERLTATNAPNWAAVQAGGKTEVVEVSDPATLRKKADEVAREVLGRKATKEEKALLVGLMQSGQLRVGEQVAGVNAANAGGGIAGPINDATGISIATGLAQQFGLQLTSDIRDEAANNAAGGKKNSDHLPGGLFAADLAGSVQQMDAFAAWARTQMGPGKLFAKVIYRTKDHFDHVHVTFNATGGPGAGPSGDPSLDAFMAATREVESGNNYSWDKVSYAGARGAYQFMPETWLGAAKMAGIDPNDHSPAAQDKAARALMSSYFAKYKDWRLVAAAWHGGPKAAENMQRTGSAGTGDRHIRTDAYADKVLGLMGGSATSAGVSPTMSGVAVVENFDADARMEEELRARNPVEAAGHDVATTFDGFLQLLRGPVPG